ncbi:hypothetical protein ACFWZ1_05435 [Frateuria sp. GZRe14]|uniref:hypothetical protein n=1 Tax=Frateuria sp. GZRe14 TaxID=3351534 RepID=UPI003EDCA628
MNELKTELQMLYADASKHSVYQSIPDFVSTELGYTESLDAGWRDDRPRLAYLLRTRKPMPDECWLDFGANTGFFTLSLARAFPTSRFIAVEANPNHARFIRRVAECFDLANVDVIARPVCMADIGSLPHSHFMLHLNVLHHAGHDFDTALVPEKAAFPSYAKRYLALLRERAEGMLFQIGSNWGGDKAQPLVPMRNDLEKLETFTGWLHGANWALRAVAYARHADGHVRYDNIVLPANGAAAGQLLQDAIDAHDLDSFPGEFYRRALFLCNRD